MTSKEAMAKLRENFENDVYYWERKMLDIVDKDLEVLEILKKSIFFHETHEYALDLKHKGPKFMNIAGNVWGEDEIAKVKEWLENE